MTYIILFIILIAAIIALIYASKLYQKEKKHRLKAEQMVRTLNRNIRILKDHEKAIQEIKKYKTGIDIMIKEAKTDEEVDSIIADILKSNNDRVLNSD